MGATKYLTRRGLSAGIFVLYSFVCGIPHAECMHSACTNGSFATARTVPPLGSVSI